MFKTDTLFDVSDRVFVITGACGLIGREIANALITRGCKLVLADIQSDVLHLAHELGEDAYAITCDVSNAVNVESLVSLCLEKMKRADVLINCHQHKPKGFLESQPEMFPEELWDAIINANLKGTFLTCREFGRLMIQQKQGSIINFASTYGVVSSNPNLYEGNSMGNPVAYSASKGAVVMLTKYLGAYWARYGVRVNCITPHGVYKQHEQAFIDKFSQMSPMKRMMNANEIIGAVLFLASNASGYVTGSNLLVEGGWTAW